MQRLHVHGARGQLHEAHLQRGEAKRAVRDGCGRVRALVGEAKWSPERGRFVAAVAWASARATEPRMKQFRTDFMCG